MGQRRQPPCVVRREIFDLIPKCDDMMEWAEAYNKPPFLDEKGRRDQSMFFQSMFIAEIMCSLLTDYLHAKPDWPVERSFTIPNEGVRAVEAIMVQVEDKMDALGYDFACRHFNQERKGLFTEFRFVWKPRG